MNYVGEELRQRDYSLEENKLEALSSEAKLVSDHASVEVTELGRIKIYLPNFLIQSEIEKFRAAQKFKLMREHPGLPTKKQMLKLLKLKANKCYK